MNRRTLLKKASIACGALLAGPAVNRRSFQLFGQSPHRYSARAVDLVQRSLVIGMQNPFAEEWGGILAPREKPGREDWFFDPASFKDSDFETFKQSGLTVIQTGVAFALPDPYEIALKYFASWNGLLAHQGDRLMRMDSPERLDLVKRSGKLGIVLGMQNSDHFRTLEDIDYFYSLGQRVSQLTYNTRNLIGSGSTERNDDGLSDFGISVVQRMNLLGMAVDVSHCGDRTSLDACEFSQAPVLATHSNCRALNPNHPRCKTDEMIKHLAATGGVMGITSFRPFVKNSEPTTIEDVLDHFDHVARLVGVEFVGVGNDSGLQPAEPSPDERKKQESYYKSNYGFRDRFFIDGLNHPQRVFDLTEGLIRRRYSDPDIEKILGGNFKRALARIWKGSAPAKFPQRTAPESPDAN
jgi:membrane dipeptidase